MRDVNTLIRRIDQELATDVTREKAVSEEMARATCERGPRLQRYDAVAKHVIELLKPRLDAFIERFKKAYLAVVRQEVALKEHLKGQLVEDPVAKVRFPKYLAASTLERNGRTYYFADEYTRGQFENEPAAK
jgi:YHS domain-containing protein